ncbi:MAG: hypothetical protein KGM15_00190 [Pseudomonadota bacterium]|nr:hypothetical protein [Pseudomonadota bacterium]
MSLAASPAVAGQTSGPYALALAGVIAAHDWSLSWTDRHVVARLFAGDEQVYYPAGHHIVVRADKVVCRISNVQITARSCQLTIHGHTASFGGAAANAVFATLAAAGVPSDGAAGSIYEAVHGLVCTLTPSVIKQNGGGGAHCAFSPGP